MLHISTLPPQRSLNLTKGNQKISMIYFFVQRPIFLKLFKHDNIIKTQFFDNMKYDLKGHPKVI